MDFVFSKIHLVAKSMENFFSTWIAQGWIVTSSSAVNQVLRQTWVLNSNASDVFINLFYQYRKAIVESAAQEAADAIGNRREIWVTLNLWWDFDLLYSIPTFTHRSPERNKKSVGDRDPNRWKSEENWQNMYNFVRHEHKPDGYLPCVELLFCYNATGWKKDQSTSDFNGSRIDISPLKIWVQN